MCDIDGGDKAKTRLKKMDLKMIITTIYVVIYRRHVVMLLQ